MAADTAVQVEPDVTDITTMMGFTISRWGSRRVPFGASSRMRVEVRPPSLRHKPASLWQQLLFWLLAPAPQDSAPPLNRLPAVRNEFTNCLRGISLAHTASTAHEIGNARSLRDLWHLRARVYTTVALHLSQAEAEVRLARLNRHFPTRAPRSGFLPQP